MTKYDWVWRWLGAHTDENGDAVFRVWAPNADEVRLTGDFCGWDAGIPMERDDRGKFCIRLEAGRIKENDFYGFRIRRGDREVLKNDPIAFRSQPYSYGSSRFYPFPRGYAWSDGSYLAARRIRYGRERGNGFSAPINIYEIHLGSWRSEFTGYRGVADRLAPYLKKMGYTHVELMPIGEYPFGGSWGYQCMSYFAPSSRYGTPEDLMYFVDRMHRDGIGVILDWVPAHFPKDEKGLYEFDGGTLYEYSDPLRQEMLGWGTRCFDLGRVEVREFLIGSALFWIEQYHIDGIRVDAVSSMIYRDYARGPGQWRPGENGSNVSEDGVSFLQELNNAVHQWHPDTLMIAEESSAWDGVTRRTEDGGLGFSMKWNMGFANDSFAYLKMDPVYRRYHHNLLTFSMTYAFHERHLLPISHDEVVYGKRSLFSKIWGDKWLKAATFRAFYAYFMTFPGKKLLFMGTEFGQENEWNWERGVEYEALGDPIHQKLHEYVANLNHLYRNTPSLWECDDGWEGFEWLLPDNADQNLLAYLRRDKRGKEMLCVVCFAGGTEISVTLPIKGKYRVVLSGNETCYGGWRSDHGSLLAESDDGIHIGMEGPFAILAEKE